MIETCPKCGGTKILSVSYGFPLDETFEAANRGEVILGGCCIGDETRPYQCTDCRTRFFEDGSGLVQAP